MITRALLLLTCCTSAAFAFQSVSLGRPRAFARYAADADAVLEDPFGAYEAGSTLAWKDVTVGKGESAEEGDVVTVSYVGKLFVSRKEFDKGPTLTFKIGGGKVMPGFEKGVVGIKEGGKRIIRIPPKLAYGEIGVRAKIPPNSDLEMEVEVAKIAKGPIAGNLALVGENRAILFAVLLAVSILSPMIGVGERGFI
jgi:hypothetical protein